MSLTATVGKERDLIEEGIFDGVCSKIIDLGTQYSETFKNSAHKIRIFWEIIGETIEINGEQMPRLVSKEFTLSLNEKSKLRQALQSWRGKAFTAEELQGFDLRKVLGIGCQLQIIHKEGNNGTTYANVETILALPRGRSVPAPQEITWFDFDNGNICDIDSRTEGFQYGTASCCICNKCCVYYASYDNGMSQCNYV